MYNYLYVAIITGCIPSEKSVVQTFSNTAAGVPSVRVVKKALRHVMKEKYGIKVSLGISDDIFGTKTRAAVKNFQLMEGLPQTGEADGETLNRLLLFIAQSEV